MLACGFSLSTFRFHTAEKELSEVDILMISAMLCNVDELVMNKVSGIRGHPGVARQGENEFPAHGLCGSAPLPVGERPPQVPLHFWPLRLRYLGGP